MEDFQVDIMVGSGTGAQSVKLPVKKFCLIGATTKLNSLSAPLRDRFGNVLKLDFYDDNEVVDIIRRNAETIGIEIAEKPLKTIASRARGTPRIANRLLKIVRDYATIGKDVENELENIFIDI